MNNVKRILVSVDGGPMDVPAMEFAAAFIKKNKAEVFLLYVVEVGRELPLNASMESELAKGEQVLDKLLEVGEKQGGRVNPEMLQARSAGAAIVGEALNRKVDLVVMGMTLKQVYGEYQVNERVKHVLLNAPCQVWVVRAPLEPDTPGGAPAASS